MAILGKSTVAGLTITQSLDGIYGIDMNGTGIHNCSYLEGAGTYDTVIFQSNIQLDSNHVFYNSSNTKGTTSYLVNGAGEFTNIASSMTSDDTTSTGIPTVGAVANFVTEYCDDAVNTTIGSGYVKAVNTASSTDTEVLTGSGSMYYNGAQIGYGKSEIDAEFAKGHKLTSIPVEFSFINPSEGEGCFYINHENISYTGGNAITALTIKGDDSLYTPGVVCENLYCKTLLPYDFDNTTITSASTLGTSTNTWGYAYINVLNSPTINTEALLSTDITAQDSIYSVNGFYQTSDIRKKDVLGDIPLEKAYKVVEDCSAIYYHMKNDDKKQIGMVAQEVETYFPELISEDEEGYKQLDYSKVAVVQNVVIKDLISRITKLENHGV